jgi:hypothetical protein
MMVSVLRFRLLSDTVEVIEDSVGKLIMEKK